MKVNDFISLSKKEFKYLERKTSYSWGFKKKRNYLDKFSLFFSKNLLKIPKYFHYLFKLLNSIKKINKDFKKLVNLPILITVKLPDSQYKYHQIFKKYFGYLEPPNKYIHIEISEYMISIFDAQIFDKKEIVTFSFLDISRLSKIQNFKLGILSLFPGTYKKVSFEILSNLFYLAFNVFNPNYLTFPYEGQLWEKALLLASKKFRFQSYGVVHALNITTQENKGIDFEEKYSPNNLIVLNEYQKSFLIKNKGWNAEKIIIRKIRENKTNIFSLVKENKSFIDFQSNNLLIVGSYLKNEDIAAFKIVQKIIELNNNLNIFYKPHPSRTDSYQRTMTNKYRKFFKFNFIKNIDNLEFQLILTPFSSSASVEMLILECDRFLVFRNSNYFVPDIFYQYNLFLNIADEESSLEEIENCINSNKKLKLKFKEEKPLKIGKFEIL